MFSRKEINLPTWIFFYFLVIFSRDSESLDSWTHENTMASSILSSLNNLAIGSFKKIVFFSTANPFHLTAAATSLNPRSTTTPPSRLPVVLSQPPARAYKSNTYRRVKSYTFGMGQVNFVGGRGREMPRYEKKRGLRPPRSGQPFGHRILHYENRYLNDIGYDAEYYKGGPKPRFNDEEKKHMHEYMTKNAPFDEWDEKAATFGQNDYIDILGDGNLSIRELNVDAPVYLRGWGYNGDRWEETQFHHVMRRLHFEEEYLLNLRPTKWWELRKEMTRHARTCNRYKFRREQRWPPN